MAMACTRILLGVAVSALAGCAAEGGSATSGPTTGAESAAETACVNLVKDMRQYCRQRSLDGRTPGGIDCLSARLEFERRCVQ